MTAAGSTTPASSTSSIRHPSQVTRGTIGGGISNQSDGVVELDSTSSVTGNTATKLGGGILNLGDAAVNGGLVSGNTAGRHGGGIYEDGTLSGAVDGVNVVSNVPDNIFVPV